MNGDAMTRLRRENPVPNELPAPPIEPLLRRLDDADARSPAVPRSPRKLTFGSVATALVAASAAALAVVAIAVIGHGRTPSSSAGSSTAANHTGVPRELLAAFAILHRSVTRADALPRKIEHTLDLPGTRGMIPAQARRVDLPNGQPVWVIPGRTITCLLGPSGGGGCDSNTSVLREGLISETVFKHGETLTGLIPDGVNHLTLTFDGGKTKNVGVHDNVFRISLPRRAHTLSFTDASGPVSQGL